MGDILSVGQNLNCLKELEQWIDTSNFLQKDLYLGEFSNEFPGPNGETLDEKGLIRENLEIYSKDDVDDLIDTRINEELNKIVDSDEENRALDFRNLLQTTILTLIQNYANTVTNTLKNYIKKDGTIPFTGRQSGVTPTAYNHLATKSYVDRVAVPKVLEYLNSNEFKAFVDLTIGDYVRSDTSERIGQLRSEVQEQFLTFNSELEDVEFIIANSLNDLSKKITLANTSIQDVSNNFSNRILINGKSLELFTSTEITLLNLIAGNTKLYNLLQFFSLFYKINIIITGVRADLLHLNFAFEGSDIVSYLVLYLNDDITISQTTPGSSAEVATKFLLIADTAVREFLETITETIYTENFYSEQ